MDLTPYVSAVRDDLTAAAAVGDEATARAGTALAAALEPAVRLALMTALSDLTTEVSTALGDREVSLRLEGRTVRVSVAGAPGDADAPDTTGGGTPGEGPDDADATEGPDRGPAGFGVGGTSPFTDPHPFGRTGSGGGFGGGGLGGLGFGAAGGPDVGDISRMTLRLVDQIKGQAEQAAAAQGMSLNSWVSQAVQGALRDAARGGGWGGGAWGGGTGGSRGPGGRGPSGGARDDGLWGDGRRREEDRPGTDDDPSGSGRSD